ncbi:MAG: hypothetical protein RL168_426 [Bacteroidota bacterium]|jgi:hypothetical protein
MTDSAFWMMLITQVTVTAITAFFFVKVLRAPAKPEPDSYEDNDAE